MGVCVDPEGNGVTMNEGAEGGPGRLAESKMGSQLSTVEAARHSWGCQKIRTGSVRGATSRPHYAQSMYR
jgi:hypothetical protein